MTSNWGHEKPVGNEVRVLDAMARGQRCDTQGSLLEYPLKTVAIGCCVGKEGRPQTSVHLLSIPENSPEGEFAPGMTIRFVEGQERIDVY